MGMGNGEKQNSRLSMGRPCQAVWVDVSLQTEKEALGRGEKCHLETAKNLTSRILYLVSKLKVYQVSQERIGV